MKSTNPFLNNKSFTKSPTVYDTNGRQVNIIDYNTTMTIQGTINKSGILLLLLVASAFVTWWLTFSGINAMVPTIGGAIVGFILVLIAVFKPQYAGYLAPGYALFQGLFIGGISAIFEMMYPGIVVQAVGATFVTFIVCFLLYKYKVVKVTEQFKSIVIASTMAIATYYIISLLLSFFTSFQPIHHGSSLMSIGISVFVIVIAAMNLFLDFDLIEKSTENKQPKYMEWFGAMGLMITLVWLYIEFLRLLSKLSNRN